MARRMMGIILLVAVAATVMFAQNASAQSAGCTTGIVSLAPCLAYITGNSSTPSSPCCTQLSSVVQTQAVCLCLLLNSGGLSYNINQTRALALPGACKVQTPPLSQCKAGTPVSSPAGSPATPATPSTPTAPGSSTPSTPATPSVPSVPAGTGSKTTPSTTSESSDAYRSSRSVFFSALFVVASVSSLVVF